MSTIVAVKKNGLAVIGADTQFNRGSLIVQPRYQKNHKKIIKFKDSYLGIIGSSAHHNVMASILSKYRKDICFNSVKDIFETFLWLHPKLKDEYFVNTSEEKDQEYESNQLHILLVNPSGIFDVMSYREVTEFSRFWSIGSGDEYALGAMYAIYDKVDDVRQIAKTGISAACEFNEKCGLPMICHTVKLKNARR